VSATLKRALTLLCALVALPMALPAPAGAADADVFKRGSRWCATTRDGHGTLDDPKEGRFGPALDIGSPDDFRWPVHAPGDGRVEIYSRGWGSGWGNSVIWTSADGTERIHLAHLDSFGATGRVEAGDLVGRVGETGIATGPHLHLSARRDGEPAAVVLMGQRIRAGRCYVSTGPIPRYCFGRPVTMLGTRGNDVIVGTPSGDVVLAGPGRDTVRTKGGPDRICAEDGNDILRGGAGTDRLDGGAGADQAVGGADQDRLFGRVGDDDLLGNADADFLDGGPGSDRLDGGPGVDECLGGEERLRCP
jgi:Ca2+-binding RTX toxin-like protein